MRRSGTVCITGFLFTVLTVATITSLMFYFTVFRKPLQLDTVPEDDKRLSPKSDGKDRKNDLTDHRSHAKPGNYYESVDYLANGSVIIEMDGTQSHTHYYDAGPPAVVGRLVSLVWFDNETHAVLGTGIKPNLRFKTGTTIVGLTVADNTRDTHTAYTTVIVKSSMFDGAYCYYYVVGANVNNDITEGDMAEFAAETESVSFKTANDFPEKYPDNMFVVRCVTQSSFDSGSQISVRHAGQLRIVVNGTQLTTRRGGGVSTGTYNGPSGNYTCQLIYTPNAPGNAQLDVVSGIREFKYNVAEILPVVEKLDPISSTLEGGGKLKIRGNGLNTNVTVIFDGKDISPESVDDDGTSVTIVVPKASRGRIVSVYVKNRNGISQKRLFEFSKGGKAPIKFQQVQINWGAYADEGVRLVKSAVTGVKYGPDHRFYMTSLNGHVSSFKLDQNMKLVGSICRSQSLGAHRKPLGLAFNYASSKVEVFVSTSIFKWKQNGIITGPLGWANGQIHVLEPSSGIPCLKEVRGPIITGLPVSNHDHGVNGLVFDDDGHLRIQVGGFTNGGHNEPNSQQNLGGIDENPLSGASLIAEVTRKGFNGRIEYTTTNPSTANLKSTRDVRVYMSGWRNSFGICIHSNKFVYATDNGPSAGFGDKSTSCNKQEAFKSEKDLLDKLGKVVEGTYGGHPNRNRGRKDPLECVFKAITDPAKGKYRPPIVKLRSATTGVMEYTANTFDGQLKNDLVLSMFKTDGAEGIMWRVRMDENGDALHEDAEKLAGKSGLSIEMTPYGGIIMPQVYGGEFIAYVPKTSDRLGPAFTAVMPARGSYKGGNKVIITGRNFVNPKALFDKKLCKSVTEVTPTSFFCIVPPGPRNTAVKVQILSEGYKTSIEGDGDDDYGYDYKYMNV